MALTRQVVSTLNADGTDVMGPTILAFHYPDQSLVSGSLLTVEANHFAVLKSRDAVIGLDAGAAAAQASHPVGTSDIQVLWNRREQMLSAIEESP